MLEQAQQQARERQQAEAPTIPLQAAGDHPPEAPTIPPRQQGDHPPQQSEEQQTLQTEREALDRLKAVTTRRANGPPVSDHERPPCITQDDDDGGGDESAAHDEVFPRPLPKWPE